MENLNFLAGKDEGWVKRNFHSVKPSFTEFKRNDIVVDKKKMKQKLRRQDFVSFFTNFRKLDDKKHRYSYDIYDVVFDREGKIFGFDRVDYQRALNESFTGEVNKMSFKTKYPVKHRRYEFTFNPIELSKFDEKTSFINWKENPFDQK